MTAIGGFIAWEIYQLISRRDDGREVFFGAMFVAAMGANIRARLLVRPLHERLAIATIWVAGLAVFLVVLGLLMRSRRASGVV